MKLEISYGYTSQAAFFEIEGIPTRKKRAVCEGVRLEMQPVSGVNFDLIGFSGEWICNTDGGD